MQVSSFSSLEIELARYGYKKIFFTECECIRCGTWRCAYDAVSSQRNSVPRCPQCSRMVQASPVLAWGYSKRETPFSERIKAPLNVNALAWINAQVDDDERDRRRTAKEQAGRNGRQFRKDRKINPDDFRGVPQSA
jgi:hypothetical protein